jgi:hypothetical protein
MKYVALLTNNAEDVERWEQMSPEEAQAARAQEIPKWNALFEELMSGGHYVEGAELESPTEAKTVRVRDGETLVTDGPYAETKEQVGGFFLLECRDLDEAIALATKIPVVSKASVELRPIIEH